MIERGEDYERCQAAIHHPKCDGYADNIDHFTPRCILKLFRTAPKDRDENNLVPMNANCHKLKDASTPKRKQLLEHQLNGEMVSLDDYRRFRNRNDAVFIPASDGD